MTHASPTIVFFGNERLSTGFTPPGAPTLEALITAGYKVAAVVSNFEPGRSRNKRVLEIEKVANQHHIPVLLPKKVTEVSDQLQELGAECGVLVAYGKIIPQKVIDIFPKGIVNIHPSLLPKYRGPTPIEQAILDGAPETGVSLMQLAKEMDAGPVFAQERVKLTGDEAKYELTEKLLRTGGDMLITHLPAILDGTLQPTPQNESEATYCQLLTKDQGQLDTAQPAEQLVRQIRAFEGWPKSSLMVFATHRVVVKKARVAADSTDGAFVIACGQQTFLELLEVVAPSGRTMNGADFLRGYRPA